MQWQIVKRVAELCYFNHDMDGWASELWEEMNEEQRAELPQLGAQQPWIYNPERRAVLQAELDAIFAHLYGLNTEDLRYILDPEDVCGKGTNSFQGSCRIPCFFKFNSCPFDDFAG